MQEISLIKTEYHDDARTKVKVKWYGYDVTSSHGIIITPHSENKLTPAKITYDIAGNKIQTAYYVNGTIGHPAGPSTPAIINYGINGEVASHQFIEYVYKSFLDYNIELQSIHYENGVERSRVYEIYHNDDDNMNYDDGVCLRYCTIDVSPDKKILGSECILVTRHPVYNSEFCFKNDDYSDLIEELNSTPADSIDKHHISLLPRGIELYEFFKEYIIPCIIDDIEISDSTKTFYRMKFMDY